MEKVLYHGMKLKSVGKSPSTGAIARIYDTHNNDRYIESKVIYRDGKQFIKIDNSLYILNGKDNFISPVTGRYINVELKSDRYEVTRDIHGYSGYKQVEVYDKKRNVVMIGRESNFKSSGEDWFLTGDYGTIDESFDSLNETRGFLEVNDVYGSSKDLLIPKGKKVGKNRFPSKMEKQIYNRGWIQGVNDPDYKTWVDKEGNTIIIEKHGNQWNVYMAVYDSEKEDYIDKNNLGKFNSFSDAQNVAFGLGSSSKRKKPITFKRSSVPRAPRSSKSPGIGKGWHHESHRHSIASKKGWRNR